MLAILIYRIIIYTKCNDMSIITIRIPNELREKMKKYPNINWSEVVREAITRKIETIERLEASKKIDQIRKRVKPVEKGELEKWIKEDRGR